MKKRAMAVGVITGPGRAERTEQGLVGVSEPYRGVKLSCDDSHWWVCLQWCVARQSPKTVVITCILIPF